MDYLTSVCDAYEDSFGHQDSAVGRRIAKNAYFSYEMAQMVAAKCSIGHMIPQLL